MDERWLKSHDAMKKVSNFTYGFAQRPVYKHWVTTGFLQLNEARRSTSGDREFDHK